MNALPARRDPSPAPAAPETLCVGEVLWDALPLGLFLGGAPFNVACHLRALGHPAALVSAVGRDRLGDEARRRVAARGVAADLVQTHDALPTGFVAVSLDAHGEPSYRIEAPAAWDALVLTDGLIGRARRARAVVYGSLAGRTPATWRVVEALAAAAPLRVFDVNLRPPHDRPAAVAAGLGPADVVKVNAAELGRLAGWFDLPADGLEPAARALAERFGAGTVCVTRGADGAALLHGGAWHEDAGAPVVVRDAVGAGDAFLAALLDGLFAGAPAAAVLARANAAGAFVAGRLGATPDLAEAALPALPTPAAP